ncbi:Rad2 nuclease [Coemansia brasiliensis]|uniref:Rad2 nuclease n=1 Tax=Coemansia brasiliensis TaxID=2650707 RepID=A0A9W8I9E5_9FUNG|nr:Rad2 nuclease [Coemansia brasiliensis]
MVESYYEPVFYCTNDGDGDDIEDEEGYETGKLFSLDSLVDDIAACSNESKIELTVGYKVQVTIHEPAAGNYVGKIAASSGTRLIELLESFDNDPTAYIATINGEEVDKSSVLGSLANGNQKVEVTISKQSQSMGITGLLPLLKEAQRKGHVKEFSGQTLGVDSYIWLYKGAFSCAVELGLDKPTSKYISFFMMRARMLRHYGIEPLFVFDGGLLPSKRDTEAVRQKNRLERRAQALKFWEQSKKKAAFEMFQKSLEATPQMAKMVIEELKKEGFRYLVAPYEADAQLAFLESTGIIYAAISEDSDLVVFGCQRLVLKMDQYGSATIFERSKIDQAKAVDIKGWSNKRIRQMCILSGCDYAASAPGIGLKRAHRYVSRASDLPAAIKLMRADGVIIPDGYEEAVVRADLTFLYQRVYDPRIKSLVHVTPLASGAPKLEDMPFIGEMLDAQIAQQIAEGDLDPLTRKPFDLQERLLPTQTSAEQQQVKRGEAAKTVKTLPKKPEAITLVSLWKKKPAFATISAKPRPKPPAEISAMASAASAAISDTTQTMHIKFRSRDSNSEMVSTPIQSRFFKKQDSAESTTSHQHPNALCSQDSSTDSQLSLTATQVSAASAADESALPLPADESALPLPADESALSLPADEPASPLPTDDNTQVCELSQPTESNKSHVVSLFGQFQNKTDNMPDWIASPKYRKGKYFY